MSKFLKRREKANEATKAVSAVTPEETDPTFAKAYPALAEFLSLETWDADTQRERGTLTIFYEQGLFKASINDRDSESVAFVSKGSFKALLDAIEKGLVTGTHDWRSWAKKGPQKGKKG